MEGLIFLACFPFSHPSFSSSPIPTVELILPVTLRFKKTSSRPSFLLYPTQDSHPHSFSFLSLYDFFLLMYLMYMLSLGSISLLPMYVGFANTVNSLVQYQGDGVRGKRCHHLAKFEDGSYHQLGRKVRLLL